MKKTQNLILSLVSKEHRWKLPLITGWSQLLGSFGDLVFLEKIENDQAFIKVQNACLANELVLKKKALIKRLNSVLNEPKIKNVLIRVGRRKKCSLEKKSQNTGKPANKNATLGDKESWALSSIKCPELKESLKMLWLRCSDLKE